MAHDPPPTSLRTETLAGLPIVTVTGTPRTMGQVVGQRLGSRIQVLVQTCMDLLEQDCSAVPKLGEGARADQERARFFHDLLMPSADALRNFEPALWMELEAIATTAQVPVSQVLLVHAFADLHSLLGGRHPAADASVIQLPADLTDNDTPRLVMSWHLPSALASHAILLRRLPDHGPASLTWCLCGLHPVAGLSEAGVAVASNELRVSDGAAGGVPTSSLVAACLTAPIFDDGLRRIQGPKRLGGRAIHLMNHDGQRRSFECSGELAVMLADRQETAPRVHTNHALDARLKPLEPTRLDPTSKPRLTHLARMAVNADGCRAPEIDRWFIPQGTDGTSLYARDHGESPTVAGVVVLEPKTKEVHGHRGVPPAGVGTVTI